MPIGGRGYKHTTIKSKVAKSEMTAGHMSGRKTTTTGKLDKEMRSNIKKGKM